MSSPVITVENVSKSYIINHHQNDGDQSTFRDKIAATSKAFISREKTKFPPTNEVLWALKDVSFEVQQGERLAIIGGNGAGKSTLFKLLSRITPPTKGKIILEGRVASLLEVGTGFHPELTGRENIFLNGTILGMSMREIKSKFDEIIDFSGVEKFLDTPVKRFSSGMYVRLAFAVAAHLQSEILIIDEVLAVGDAEFQKKCLGKMQDVSQNGRTILIVSHTMTTIQSLCTIGIFLKNGAIQKFGNVNDVVNDYLYENKKTDQRLSEITNRKGNGNLIFINGIIENDSVQIETFKDLTIVLDYALRDDVMIQQYKIEVNINNRFGQRVALMSTHIVNTAFDIKSEKVIFRINNLPLVPGDYICNIYAEINNEMADLLSDVIPFTIIERDYYNSGRMILPNLVPVLLKYDVF